MGAETALLPGLSIIVPVYNSQPTLGDLVGRLERVLDGISPGAYELILVNDGSRDESWAVLEKLAPEHPRLVAINLMRNYGQHNALLCGIRSARYATTITLDDDLQNPPEEIPLLLAELERGADVVYGRPEREQHGVLRDLASQITKMVLAKAMGAATARHISAFRAFRTRLRQAFDGFNSPYVSIDVLLTWGTGRFAVVAVRHEMRAVGKSNYTLRKLVVHAFNMMTGFSTWPLRLASMIGFAFTLFGLGILVFVVANYIIHGGSPTAGFPFLASIIALFSGAQLFAIGIIGEYLARLHFRMMDRPTYTVQDRLGSSRSGGSEF